ncbi:MAG: prolipoprotein diacylglyceryl transferase [Phycisphaerales bacterium]|nr:prolipoprotein diacylglyceryl transferase [Phycisphaerales bacterium]
MDAAFTPILAPTLAAWLHDWDPVAFRLGPATIYWYGFSYVVGFALAWLLLRVVAWRGLTPIPGSVIGDIVLFGGIGGVIGGRLGYAFVYKPSLLTDFSSGFPFWGVLNIVGGGMASHGGMVGVLAGLALLGVIMRRRAAKEDLPQLANVPTLHLVDTACAVVPIGLMCGRLANFINGELLGKIVVAPDDKMPWWAVRFPHEIISRYGTGEISGAQIVRATEAVGMSQMEMLTPDGETRFIEAYAALLEQLRNGTTEQQRVAANFMQEFVNARHPSQLYQAALEGPLLLLALAIIWAKPRIAGVVMAWFMILYGVGRIATEFFRLPDAGFVTARPLGLSRGQWLSVALVMGGVGLLAFVVRRAKKRRTAGESVPVFGGWLAPAFPAALSTKSGDTEGRGPAKDDKAE